MENFIFMQCLCLGTSIASASWFLGDISYRKDRQLQSKSYIFKKQ